MNLITKKDEYIELTNDLTREMDSYYAYDKKYLEYTRTYLYPYDKNIWLIRFPGATRGRIVLNNDGIIVEIELYDDEYRTDDIYKPEVRECFKKYIGMKLVIV